MFYKYLIVAVLLLRGHLIAVVTGDLLHPNKGGPGLLGSSISSIVQPQAIVDKVLNNTPDVFWFYDDDGNLVKPTFELPSLSEIDTSLVEDKVVFTLYTKNKVDGEPLILGDVEKLKSTTFDPKRETVFITHGWVNSARSKACTLIRDAYLKKTDFNVIVVDWSKITLRPYGWAASHTKKVGKHVAKMIDFLEEQGMDVNKLKLIGHSLGAQVMGSAGYHAKNKVNYVVGLDPALPLFFSSIPGTRISEHDAKNVEIIHTNGGHLGILVPVGHVDFYPNGGQKQIGCIADPGGACSHARSYELFAESIISDTGFYGKPCRSYLKMTLGQCNGESYAMGGLKDVLENKGSYYLETRTLKPFAMGKI